MNRKTALITGANKSIGFETARQLGHAGYRIWLGCREVERGQAAAAELVQEGLEIRLIEIDVTSEESVRLAAEKVHLEDGHLDVLINNAGILGSSSDHADEQPIDDIRAIYETNVFGPIRVTQAFKPLLKAAGHANIVMVSSGLGSLGWLSDPQHPFYGVNALGYGSSKSALNAVTVSMAKSLAPDGITVNAADPGYTATDFNGHSGYRSVQQAASGIVWLARQEPSGPSGGFYFDQQRAPW